MIEMLESGMLDKYIVIACAFILGCLWKGR